MTSRRYLLAAYLTLGCLLLGFLAGYFSLTTKNQLGARSMAFDRVMETKVLRICYLIQPPFLLKSGATGTLSGIYFDLVETIGKRLNLKVQWVEEVNLATLSEGLDTGRYDLIGFALWRSSARAKSVFF